MGKKGKQSSAPKKSKKGKEKEDPVEVELTDRQKREQRRAAARERSKHNREAVAGTSWTGKLPGNLLQEHCQRQKWNRVDYGMKETKEGFVSWVTLSWKNPKTQETIKVRMNPPADLIQPQETALEARHYAATYALHRIASEKNIHMVLPTPHKNLWLDLEARRKELVKADPNKAQREYTSEPFTAVLEHRKLQEKWAKERQAQEAEKAKTKKPTIVIGSKKKAVKADPVKFMDRLSAESQVTFPRKVWENTVMMDLEPHTRALIDSAIRHHIDWSEGKDEGASSDNYSSLLEQIGFRKSHVDEALQYTFTFTDSLEWLLFHIPEDDLPPIFMKNDQDSNVRLRITKDITKEAKIDTLCEGSCSRNEASTALDLSDGDMCSAAVKLTRRLVVFEPTETEKEPERVWKEEKESLSAIYGNRVRSGDDIYEVVLQVEGLPESKKKDLLALRASRSPNYPCDICGLQLVVKDQSYRLPKYINRSILTKLLHYVATELTGLPYVYSCVDWLENHIVQIIAQPGPLYDPSVEVSSQTRAKTHNTKKKQRRTFKRSKELLKSMADEYLHRETPELKQSVSKRSRLPAWKKRDELVKVIQSNRACIVTGETGSGKSTQIVQFILDALCSQGDFSTNIICTQPRRISAIGLADRVAAERAQKVGEDIGYIIRGETRKGKTTRITFATTGVLLRVIQSLYGDNADSSFDDVGYVFVDEVHERSIDSDFLLIILKRMLKRFPKLRVVLMSATIDPNQFRSFFGSEPAHVHIEGRTFPIKDFYLDTILTDLDFTITTRNDEVIRPNADSKFFAEGNIDYTLIAKLVSQVDRELTKQGSDGSILIFLPGVLEINKTLRELDGDFWGLPLHSGVSSHDQRKVFLSPPHGKRKVVASTNVAETSVTIPDAVAVIDTGRVKSIRYDTKSDTTRLLESWASRAEVAQRRGRAGRVREGLCYRLFTEETEQSTMLAQPIPEIKRTPLGAVYLVVKAMGVTDVYKFLQEGIDPPAQVNVDNAAQTLTEVGALRNNHLTALGRYLSLLPTDMKSGKILLYSTLFGCVESGITLASISISGNPFLRSHELRDRVKKIQNTFSKGEGDLIAILNAYNAYVDTASGKKSRFLEDNCLSRMTIRDIQSTRAQYVADLTDMGFLPMGYSKHPEKFPHFNRHSSNMAILRSIAIASLFPHIARVQPPDPKFLASASGAVAVDPDARQIKYWIRNEQYIKELRSGGNPREHNLLPATRAFLHPSSTFFTFTGHSQDVSESDIKMDADGNYIWAPTVSSSSSSLSSSFVAYESANTTSKLYLHDVTPTSVLALLLFGGSITYDLSSIRTYKPSPGIVMDGWLPIRTWCKNAVMITRLRKLLDRFLDQRLATPLYGEQKESANDADLLNSDILTTIERMLSIERR